MHDACAKTSGTNIGIQDETLLTSFGFLFRNVHPIHPLLAMINKKNKGTVDAIFWVDGGIKTSLLENVSCSPQLLFNRKNI